MRSLSRKIAHRTSMLRNLATSLILYEKIKTTTAKAKEVKPLVEHYINLGRKKDVTARRSLQGFFFDKNATLKVIEELVPRYKNFKTGFIYTYKIGPRLGDKAEMAILELAKPKLKESKNASNKDQKQPSKEENFQNRKTKTPSK